MRVEWEDRKPPRRLPRILPCPSPSSSPKSGLPSPPPTPNVISPRVPASKRLRAEEDVDGENSKDLQRKKRRLRLELFTSRLSRPYATPTTNILTRKVIKNNFRLQPRVAKRDFFRKIAILNSYKRSRLRMGVKGLEKAMSPKLATIYEATEKLDFDDNGDGKPPPAPAVDAYCPSPLGQNYYDALDDEDDDEDLRANDSDEEDDPDEDSICTYGDYFDSSGISTEKGESSLEGATYLVERPKLRDPDDDRGQVEGHVVIV